MQRPSLSLLTYWLESRVPLVRLTVVPHDLVGDIAVQPPLAMRCSMISRRCVPACTCSGVRL